MHSHLTGWFWNLKFRSILLGLYFFLLPMFFLEVRLWDAPWSVFSASHGVAGLLGAVVLSDTLAGRQKLYIPRLPCLVMGVWYVVAFAGVYHATGKFLSDQLWHWILFGGFFLLFVNAVRSQGDLDAIFAAMLAQIVVQTVIGSYQVLTGHDPHWGPVAPISNPGEFVVLGEARVHRAVGTLFHANLLGSYLVFVLPMAVGAAVFSARKMTRRIGGICAVLGTGLCILTFLVGAWVSLAAIVGILIFLFKGNLRRKSTWQLWLPVTAALLAVAGLFGPLVYARLFDSNPQVGTRIIQIQTAWKMFMDAPLWGVGLNHYMEHVTEYDPEASRFLRTSPVHSWPFGMLAETGIVGMMLLVSCLGLTYHRLKKRLIECLPVERRSLIWIAMGATGMLIHACGDNTYYSEVFKVHLALFMALIWMKKITGSAEV